MLTVFAKHYGDWLKLSSHDSLTEATKYVARNIRRGAGTERIEIRDENDHVIRTLYDYKWSN